MKAREALSSALVMVIESTHPVINVREISEEAE